MLYILKPGQSFPSIPVAPTRQQAREAPDHLDGTLLEEFPFVGKIDRAVALSLILTALDRHAMATAPLHGFTSPVAGTGKSLLVDIASLLANGEITPVISQGSSKDETEKRLGAELLSGSAIVSFDNCSAEVDSDLLCQALTQRELRVRELGYSRNVKVPITALFTANGNNILALQQKRPRRRRARRRVASNPAQGSVSRARRDRVRARHEGGRLLFVTLEVGGRGSRTILRGLRLHLRRGGFESIDPRCGGRER